MMILAFNIDALIFLIIACLGIGGLISLVIYNAFKEGWHKSRKEGKWWI